MNTEWKDAFKAKAEANKAGVLSQWKTSPPDSYSDIFRDLVKAVQDKDDYSTPDPDRITTVDHGDYQGTQLFVVGASGYQPSIYWATTASYGSCSGCDSLQSITVGFAYDDNYNKCKPSDTDLESLWSLLKDMLAGMVQIN